MHSKRARQFSVGDARFWPPQMRGSGRPVGRWGCMGWARVGRAWFSPGSIQPIQSLFLSSGLFAGCRKQGEGEGARVGWAEAGR